MTPNSDTGSPEVFRIQWVREALAAHEAFRKLEYPSEAIFVVPGSGPEKSNLFVLLSFEGKRFSVDVGPCELQGEEFAAVWKRAAEWWNANANGSEGKKIWEESGIRRNSVSFVISMTEAGLASRKGLS